MHQHRQCCRLDDLISACQKLRQEHGNMLVCLRDPDTGYEMPVGVSVRESEYRVAPLVMIQAKYHKDPDGYIEPTPGVVVEGHGPEQEHIRIYDGVVIAVDPGDSRCCHRKCPSLRLDPAVGTCDRYGDITVKAAGAAVNAGAAGDAWFRCPACVFAFGG